mgnify:CR=1 FL=1
MRIWGGYLLVLMAWVVAVMALAFLGFIICASITWQPSPLYDFLNWVRDYIVLVCIVTVLAGHQLLFYLQAHQAAGRGGQCGREIIPPQ